MNQIISPIDHKVFEALVKIDVTIDTCEDGINKFTNATLSVYDGDLHVNQLDQTDNVFEEYNLANEAHFVNFIHDVYEENKTNTVVVETKINELDNATLMRILTLLDYRDKLQFIDFIKCYSNSSYIVRSENILSLLTKLATRELLFSTFHFLNKKITICCHKGLNFSVFVSDFNDLETYIELARKNGLYLKNIHVKY